MLIELIPLKQGDPYLDELIRIHDEPSIARYISISDNYFNYLTETKGIIYYKIMNEGILIGGIHSEVHDETIYISVCVDEKYRRLGIAEKAVNVFVSMVPSSVKTIEVSIEETNVPSVCLFQKLGFQLAGQEDELITYRKLL